MSALLTRLTRSVAPPGLASVALAAAILIAGAVVLDRVAELALKEVLLHSRYRYMRVYRDGPPAQYLIIGNSRAGVHFPHSTDPSGAFFNLGSGGMGALYSAALALDYLDHHGAPKVAVIEMAFMSDPRYGEGVAGLARIFSERARAIRRDETWFHAAATKAFHLIRFNHATLLNALAGLLIERQGRAVNVQISDAMLRHAIEMQPFEERLLPDNVAALTDLIGELRRRGIRVVCVLSPILPERRDKAINLAQFTAGLRRLAEDSGAMFFDDSALISDHALFADQAHLNAAGVQLYDEMFFKRLGE
jgi:hypothetical protein